LTELDSQGGGGGGGRICVCVYICCGCGCGYDAKMTMPQVDGKKCSTRKTMLFELGSTPWKLQMLGVAVCTKNDAR